MHLYMIKVDWLLWLLHVPHFSIHPPYILKSSYAPLGLAALNIQEEQMKGSLKSSNQLTFTSYQAAFE